MRIPRLACALLAASAFTASGCMLTGSPTRTSWFRPSAEKDFDDEDLLSEDAHLEEEDKDPWSFVGKEGRSELDSERDPDPAWLRNLFTSEKARAIERTQQRSRVALGHAVEVRLHSAACAGFVVFLREQRSWH